MPSVIVETKGLRFNAVIPDLPSLLMLKLSTAMSDACEKKSGLIPWEKVALTMAAGIEPEIKALDGNIWISTPDMIFDRSGDRWELSSPSGENKTILGAS